jgi:hypothetical protein
VVVDIHRVGAARLARLKAVAELDSWLELDRELLACGSAASLATLEELSPVRRRLDTLRPDQMRLAYALTRAELEHLGLRVLASGGRFAVVDIRDLRPPERLREPAELLPFTPNLVLARQLANEPPRRRSLEPDEGIAGLVNEVSVEHWFDEVSRLAEFNRYTHGPEIDPAREWLVNRFSRLPRLRVEEQGFDAEGTPSFNVVATLRGKRRPDDWYIVGGHYDSKSENPLIAAPGAEDNASGCAGVLEMARVFSFYSPKATVIFICFAAEEQGLYGSIDHASRLIASGDDRKVEAMLSMDMIGYSADSDLDCLLQSDPAGQALIDAFSDAAELHTSLRIVTSLFVGGSDHAPYSQLGMPALMTIENDWDVYPHFHLTTDLPEHLVPEMAEQILRMNVAALARLAGGGGGGEDLSGCLEAEGEPVARAEVILTQSGEPRRTSRTGRRGCFAAESLAAEKRFRVRVRSDGLAPEASIVSGCFRLVGKPLAGRRITLRQIGEPRRRARTDSGGCFAAEAVGGKNFKLTVRGPTVPER